MSDTDINNIINHNAMITESEDDILRNVSRDDTKYKQVRSFSEPNLLSSSYESKAEYDKLRSYTRQSSTLYPYIKEFKNSSNVKYNHGKKQYYSFFCLAPDNPVRALAILITESKLFEYFILVAILFTCIVMALDAPLPQSDKSKMNKIAELIEYFLLAIFFLEALLKIIAMGFILHPHSYLRSIWNILDFVVLIFGILTLFPQSYQSFNIKPLRAVRVLRPLKLISGIPSLQVVMTSIVRAMFPLLQVLFLVVFVMIIYSIIGLEFFYNRFHYSCKYTVNDTFVDESIPCDIKRQDDTFYYVKGRACPNKQSTCQRYSVGLNNGITSFDNIFLAMITVFQCITMEGWTDIMYHTFGLLDEHGYIWSSYYISLIVIGSFFMLNLVLGVLSGEFAKEREKVENRREFLKLRTEQQIARICDTYLEWISKGEDLMIEEEADEISASTPKKKLDLNVIINPALVRHQPSNSNQQHVTKIQRKTKFEQLQLHVKRLRLRLRKVVKHDYFFWLVVCMVFINTIIMGTKHYLQPDWLTNMQAIAEKVFISIFTVELLIKLFAYGFTVYFKSLFNCFDFVVVILSIVELIIITQFFDHGLGLSVLRSLRLLRIFKVTKYWSSLRNLVTSLMNAIKSILSLMFLLFLFIVISALLGMQLFGGKFVKLETFPRTNFDTFPDSMLAVFQVITGEDWNVVMYDGIMAYGGPKELAGVCISLYFIFLVIFGNYTLLNVFLAIAVDNLTNAQILTHDEETEEAFRRDDHVWNALQGNPTLKEHALTLVNNLQQKASEVSTSSSSDNGFNAPLAIKDTADQSNEDLTENRLLTTGEQRNPQSRRNSTFLQLLSPNISRNGDVKLTVFTPEGRRRNSNLFDNLDDQARHQEKMRNKWFKIVKMNSERPDIFSNNNVIAKNEAADSSESLSESKSYQEDVEEDDDDDMEEQIKDFGLLNVLKVNVGNRRRITKVVPIVQKSSLFVFSPNNWFRKACHKIIHFRYFDWFIMLVIIMSSVALAIEDPVNDDAEINQILHYFDYFFTVVFGLEVLLKIIDCGFILHPGSYMRNSWNVLDIFVFLCNLTSLILSNNLLTGVQSNTENITKVVKTLRVLRVLRPLKAIHKVKKLKAVFQCMVYSLKNVTFVLIITWLILFIFACIGVQLYMGKFYYCTDRSKMTQVECQGDYYRFPTMLSVVNNKPEVNKREWKRYDFHFDNIFDAALTLYTSSTGEGWPSSMHHTVDATTAGRGPIKNNRQYMAIYYIIFVVIFTFMIINIYIALIILTFQRQGEKEIEGGLDRNQRDCIQFVLNSKPRVRYIPDDRNSIQYHVWYVVDSQAFEYFIMGLIILNTIQLMMKYDGNTENYVAMLKSLNIAFTGMFCLEAFLKIVAYRISYFKDLWNLFDLLVILGSLGDIILSEKSIKFIDPSMFRLCRAARIIKLLRKGASIRVMLWTFLQSFKALPYVTCLILLLFYIYAVIGMQTFGKIKLIEGKTIFKYNNFTGIIQALQVLLRCSTGESWNMIMRACYDDAECVGDNKNCGNTWISRIYFSSFIFLSMFLLLNLFIAVIMDNFEYLTRDSSILGPHHLDEFVRCWSQFDPKASGRIHHERLYNMMCNLTPPVGFGKKCPKSVAYKRLIRMNMPIDNDGMVTFHMTLLAVIRARLDVYVKGNMYNNNQELRRVIQSLWPKTGNKLLDKLIPKYQSGDDDKLTVGKVYCVKLLVMNHRNVRGKKKSEVNIVLEEKSPSVLSRFIPASFRKKKATNERLQQFNQSKLSNEQSRRNNTFPSRALNIRLEH